MKIYKRSFLTLAITLLSFSGFAQESFSAKAKGTFLANGSINIYSTTRKIEVNNNDDKADAFTINVTPKVGYFVMDNLAVGLDLIIISNKETQSDEFGEIETTTTGFGIGPFARYYFDNGLFGEALVGIGSTKTKTDGGLFGNNELKSSTFGFRIGAGYSFFLGEHVAIEPTVNYSWEDINPDGASSDYKESISSIFLGIGISAYF